MEICRFLVKLQAFCRILTKPEASAIFFTDSGRKPDAQAEACFLRLRAAHVRGAAGRSRPCHLNFYRRHEGVCLWLASRAGPFFIWQKEEAFL